MLPDPTPAAAPTKPVEDQRFQLIATLHGTPSRRHLSRVPRGPVRAPLAFRRLAFRRIAARPTLPRRQGGTVAAPDRFNARAFAART